MYGYTESISNILSQNHNVLIYRYQLTFLHKMHEYRRNVTEQ